MSLNFETADFLKLFGEKKEYAWGLDLGTFRSCVACMDKSMKERPVTPRYSEPCEGGVPSLFYRGPDGTERVGDEVALHNDQNNDPKGVCSSIKTRLGETAITLNGHSYTPYEIGVKVTERVMAVSKKLLAAEMLPTEIPALVAGAPVRFNAAQRGELQKIIQAATGNIPVQLVAEPILAALAANYLTAQGGQSPTRPVLVFDMGAGTFDTVVLKPNFTPTAEEPFPYIALKPMGSQNAGDRMDELMTELLLDKIRANPGRLHPETLFNKNHIDYRKLSTITAREVKERLSKMQDYPTHISGVECGSDIFTVTRKEYEERIDAVIQENVDLAMEVVKHSGFWNSPDLEVLLVGGSTYIPLVQKKLQEAFSWLDSSQIQQRVPETAVALGAAIYAAQPRMVRPKVSYAYAVEVYNSNPSYARSMLHVRIPSGAKLPATIKGTYYTRFEGQESVLFKVYEVQEGKEGEFLELNQGKQVIQDQKGYGLEHFFGRKVPQNTVVDLTVTLDTSGTLTLEIDDLGIKGEITRGKVTLSNICG